MNVGYLAFGEKIPVVATELSIRREVFLKY